MLWASFSFYVFLVEATVHFVTARFGVMNHVLNWADYL